MDEVGLRHCFNLPIVHLAQDGEKPPFDLAAERIIFFDINDLGSVEDGKQRLLSSCQKALKSKPFKSPVVRALEMETLFASAQDLPSATTIVEKLEEIDNSISDLNGGFDSLYQSIGEAIYSDIPEQSFQYSERIQELVRLFDLVGPSDIAALARAAKKFGLNAK